MNNFWYFIPVITKTELAEARKTVSEIYLDDKLVEYIVNLVFATRDPMKYGLDQLKGLIACGASPRATIALAKAARAMAFLQNRHFVIPDDIKYVAIATLRHRIVLTYQAAAEEISVDKVIRVILDSVIVP